MALNKYAREYEHNSIFTASPEELTLMLYNGAIKFVKQTEFNIQDKAFDKANDNCKKAQNIISELMNTLDMKYDMSQQLYSLYEYIHRRLMEGNMKKDTEILKESREFIEQLRDTWEEAMKIARRQRA
ncbi:MAG: flagellar export chaperone FliS [Ignavibacteriales bacterium]